MKKLITPSEAARMLRVTTGTLARWRKAGVGPAYVKLGRGRAPVRYELAEIERGLGLDRGRAS